jgi:hypothetical protein
MPKTSQEYRDLFKNDTPSGARKETTVVGRPFGEIYGILKSNTDKCFNAVVTSYSPNPMGTPTVTQVQYRSTTRETRPGSSETVINLYQYIFMVVDLETSGPSKTKAAMYGSGASIYEKMYQSVWDWAQGEGSGAPCPKLD